MGTTNHYGYTKEGELFMSLPNEGWFILHLITV